jgi:hypothetical protein
MLAAGLCMAALLVAGSAALAQRDGADRSQRLDSEEFRNDMSQRLNQPTAPLSGQPATTTTSDSNNKPVHTKKKK